MIKMIDMFAAKFRTEVEKKILIFAYGDQIFNKL